MIGARSSWRRSGRWRSLGSRRGSGRETVRLGNTGESVTAHLAAAMRSLGLLVFLLVRLVYPARLAVRGASQRFTLLATFAAASTFALLLSARTSRPAAHVAGVRRLAADGWLALPGPHRAVDQRPRAAPLDRGRRGRDRRRHRDRRLADPARPPDRSCGWPWRPSSLSTRSRRGRRAAGPDAARARGRRRSTSRSARSIWALLGRSRDRQLLHRPRGGRETPATAAARGARDGDRDGARRAAAGTRSAPTSR